MHPQRHEPFEHAVPRVIQRALRGQRHEAVETEGPLERACDVLERAGGRCDRRHAATILLPGITVGRRAHRWHGRCTVPRLGNASRATSSHRAACRARSPPRLRPPARRAAVRFRLGGGRAAAPPGTPPPRAPPPAAPPPPPRPPPPRAGGHRARALPAAATPPPS